MGFVRESGEAHSFDEIEKHIPKVREDAIMQFLHLIKKFAGIISDDSLWGDETEFHIVHLDNAAKKARLSIGRCQLVPKIKDKDFEAQYEFGSWMIESISKNPFHIGCEPEEVRKNIQARRLGIEKYLTPEEFALTCPVFPLIGVGDFYHMKDSGFKEQHSVKVDSVLGLRKASVVPKSSEELEEGKGEPVDPFRGGEKNFLTSSKFVPDYMVNTHPRYVTAARNIVLRRGEKLHMAVPMYKDKNTSFEPSEEEPIPGYIYMDTIVFSMGCCCLQQTFSTKGYHEARYLYDQLAIISPLMVNLLCVIR